MSHRGNLGTEKTRDVEIPVGEIHLGGELSIPVGAQSIVLFAHAPGGSRHSPRNRHLAKLVRRAGIGTLLFDLLTEEESIEVRAGHSRFDVDLLAKRLAEVTLWLKRDSDTWTLRVGYFGTSTGAGAALAAAAKLNSEIGAVVSRSGRPDLAGEKFLRKVTAPTLLIVGARDEPVIEMNEAALAQMNCQKKLTIVPNAAHLFEEPGTLDKAARLAVGWFETHLAVESVGAL